MINAAIIPTTLSLDLLNAHIYRISLTLFGTEKACWFNGEDYRHGKKEGEVREFWKKALTPAIDQSHQDTPNCCSLEAPHAPHDHHNESQRQHSKIGPGIHPEKRGGYDSAECSQKGSKAEHES